jgi:hypothetical protein
MPRAYHLISRLCLEVCPVLRQNLIRVENGLIPRCNDLDMTRELNQKASPIG